MWCSLCFMLSLLLPCLAGTKLLVNNLDPEITAEELKELFESIGAVRSASIELDADGSKVRVRSVAWLTSGWGPSFPPPPLTHPLPCTVTTL